METEKVAGQRRVEPVIVINQKHPGYKKVVAKN